MCAAFGQQWRIFTILFLGKKKRKGIKLGHRVGNAKTSKLQYWMGHFSSIMNDFEYLIIQILHRPAVFLKEIKFKKVRKTTTVWRILAATAQTKVSYMRFYQSNLNLPWRWPFYSLGTSRRRQMQVDHNWIANEAGNFVRSKNSTAWETGQKFTHVTQIFLNWSMENKCLQYLTAS